MPRKAVDYSNTIIYKIQHQDKPELLYVGSTINFTKRKHEHKHRCNNENRHGHNSKVYQMIRENGGWTEFCMIEIKKFPCQSKREAEAEENRIMLEMKANMNSNRAYKITDEEELKKYNLQRHQRYYQNNIEKIKEYQKKYRDDNCLKKKEYMICDCGCSITRASLSRHKKSDKHIKLMKYYELI